MSRPKRIGIIGAGASGIISAKELVHVGGFKLSEITVFELNPAIGGVWVLTEGSPLNVDFRDPNFEKRDPYDSTSLYPELRTQMPIKAIEFRDFPVPSEWKVETFPKAHVVAEYVAAFADHHGITPRVKLNTKVDSLWWDAESKVWNLVTRERVAGSLPDPTNFDSRWGPEVLHQFEAVISASGHYTFPTIPNIPGQDKFPARFIHSHDYRDPEQFRDQTVLIIGSGTSATDVARLISRKTKQIFLSTRDSRIWEIEKLDSFVESRAIKLEKTAPVAKFVADGRKVILEDGRELAGIDTVILATGYRFEFPYLRKGAERGPLSDSGVKLPHGSEYFELVADGTGRTVKNLWKKIIYTRNPTLAFVGLPLKILSFPLFEIQSALPAKLWSGQVQIPRDEQVLVALEEEEAKAYGAKDRNDRQTLLMTAFQWEYQDSLSEFLGIWRFDEQRRQEIQEGIQWWFKRRYEEVPY